jgi:hypothetical protein
MKEQEEHNIAEIVEETTKKPNPFVSVMKDVRDIIVELGFTGCVGVIIIGGVIYGIGALVSQAATTGKTYYSDVESVTPVEIVLENGAKLRRSSPLSVRPGDLVAYRDPTPGAKKAVGAQLAGAGPDGSDLKIGRIRQADDSVSYIEKKMMNRLKLEEQIALLSADADIIGDMYAMTDPSLPEDRRIDQAKTMLRGRALEIISARRIEQGR